LRIDVADDPLKFGLLCRKLSIPVHCLLQQSGLFLQLLLQLRGSLSKLPPGLLHLALTGSFGILERPLVLQLSLDQLVLQFSGVASLGCQRVLVLNGHLLLLGCSYEQTKLGKRSRWAQTKEKTNRQPYP
jgi:hypothetical protein